MFDWMKNNEFKAADDELKRRERSMLKAAPSGFKMALLFDDSGTINRDMSDEMLIHVYAAIDLLRLAGLTGVELDPVKLRLAIEEEMRRRGLLP